MLNSSIWRAVLSLFYPPVIIQGKNGKNSESPVGSNKSEKRKPKSAVYRSILASVVYFHIRLISTRRHKREMTRNAVYRKVPRVRIPNSPPDRGKRLLASVFLYPVSSRSSSPVGNSDKSAALWNSPLFSRLADRCTDSDTSRCA